MFESWRPWVYYAYAMFLGKMLGILWGTIGGDQHLFTLAACIFLGMQAGRLARLDVYAEYGSPRLRFIESYVEKNGCLTKNSDQS